MIAIGLASVLPLVGLMLMALEKEKLFEPNVRSLLLDIEASLATLTHMSINRVYIGFNSTSTLEVVMSKAYHLWREF